MILTRHSRFQEFQLNHRVVISAELIFLMELVPQDEKIPFDLMMIRL